MSFSTDYIPELRALQTRKDELRQLFRDGVSPTDLIRTIARWCPQAGPGDMQLVFMDVFALSFSEAIPATWWWIDGSFEVSEATASARLRAALDLARTRWDRTGA